MPPPLLGFVACLLATESAALIAPATCGTAGSCASCVAWSGCGWCGSSAFCVAGSADGPTSGRCPLIGRASGWRHSEFLNCTVAAPSAFIHNRSSAWGPTATEELAPLRLRALKRSAPPDLPPPPPCKEPEPPPEAEEKSDSKEEAEASEVAAPAPVFVLPTVPPTPPAPPREHVIYIHGFPTFPPHPDCPEPCETVSPEAMAEAIKAVLPDEPAEPDPTELMNASSTKANATLLSIRSLRRPAFRGRKAERRPLQM